MADNRFWQTKWQDNCPKIPTSDRQSGLLHVSIAREVIRHPAACGLIDRE